MKLKLSHIILFCCLGLTPMLSFAQKSKSKRKSNVKTQKVQTLKLGQVYEGGVIFSLSEDKLSGKVISLDPLPFAGIKSWESAKTLCVKYKVGKITGWRLPTIEEMSLSHYILDTYSPNVVQGNYKFVSSGFWTSSPGKEKDQYYVYDYAIERGYMQSKDQWNNVCPVRDFKVK